MTWIPTRQFAAMAGIDRRSAARVLKSAHDSKIAWQGRHLKVKLVADQRGGAGGQCYRVKLDSLPDRFRIAKARKPGVERSTSVILDHAALFANGDRHSTRIAARFRAIAPASDAPKGSEARHLLLSAAARQENRSIATLYRWLADYEASGLAGLAPDINRVRRSPLIISRKFDRALRDRGEGDVLSSIGAEFENGVKRLWTTRSSAKGMAAMSRDLAAELRLLCESRGIDVDKLDCTPSLQRVREFANYALVRTVYTDAKMYRDQQPRIRRTYDQLAPMDLVFVDVKFGDVFIGEPGNKRRPALIGFFDAATRRIFTHFMLLPERQAPRSEDVAAALAAMCVHPQWGLPAALYTDNGSEMAGLVDSMSRLATLRNAAPVIKARPHNPQAKPIEGLFGTLNRIVFRQFPGFTGGKARQLVPALGVQPKPFENYQEFLAAIQPLLDEYHGFSRGKGISPDERYAQKVDKGHQPRLLSDADAAAVFGKKVFRSVKQGAVMLRQVRYTHDQLYKSLGGKLSLMMAAKTKEESAPYMMGPGGTLSKLIKDKPYGPTDPQGLNESDRRQDITRKEALRLARDVEMQSLEHSVNMALLNIGRRARDAASASGGMSVSLSLTEAQLAALDRKESRARLYSWFQR